MAFCFKEKRLNILLISKIYPSPNDPDYGVFVLNIEKAILEKGGIVVKSVIRGRVRSKFQKLSKYLFFFFSVFKNLVTKDYDLIYVHFANHSLIPLLPVYRFIKKPLVINAHGGDITPAKRKNGKLINKLTHNIIQSAAMIVVPSNYYKNITRKLYGKKVIYISPSGGVDLSLFKPAEICDSHNNILRLGYVSRIDTGKGWDVFLRALYLLKNRYPKLIFKAYIVGHGRDVDRLQIMIKELGLKQARYIKPKKQAELAKMYSSFDLFIFPTTRPEETLGLVGIEAMACGVPVIGSQIGGLVEYLRDNENGYLFTPGDHEELANRIIDYIALNPDKKRQMREAALRTAEKYSKDVVADDLYSELSKLI